MVGGDRIAAVDELAIQGHRRVPAAVEGEVPAEAQDAIADAAILVAQA